LMTFYLRLCTDGLSKVPQKSAILGTVDCLWYFWVFLQRTDFVQPGTIKHLFLIWPIHFDRVNLQGI
jgi:hypothetical protein